MRSGDDREDCNEHVHWHFLSTRKFIDIGSCSPLSHDPWRVTFRFWYWRGSVCVCVCVCVCLCFLLFYKVTCGQMDSCGPSKCRIERAVLEMYSEVFNVPLRKHTSVVELLTCTEGINIKFIICRRFISCCLFYPIRQCNFCTICLKGQ